MINMANIYLITWAEMGITVDKEVETDTSYSLYISVPEHSYHKDVNGIEMAGKHLATRIKTSLIEMGVQNLSVMFKVRAGDNWTKEKALEAYNTMGRKLYRSQWKDKTQLIEEPL